MVWWSKFEWWMCSLMEFPFIALSLHIRTEKICIRLPRQFHANVNENYHFEWRSLQGYNSEEEKPYQLIWSVQFWIEFAPFFSVLVQWRENLSVFHYASHFECGVDFSKLCWLHARFTLHTELIAYLISRSSCCRRYTEILMMRWREKTLIHSSKQMMFIFYRIYFSH